MSGCPRRSAGSPASRAILAALGLAAALSAIATGCASPQATRRMGLLEQVSEADHSRRSHRFAALDQSPAARRAAEAEEREDRAAQSEGARAEPRTDRAREIATGKLHWPLAQNKVTSEFGKRGREFHEGIDLKASTGTPVLAAQDGTVIYSGVKIRGYGRMVVVRHFKQISTIYAHNSKLLVRVGQYVRQGQKIAISGKSGHVTGPHLHFEVRDGLAALNPLEFLPATPAAAELPIPTAPIAQAQAPAHKARARRARPAGRRIASESHARRSRRHSTQPQ